MSAKNLNIKVCGMRDETNIKELVGISPDYIGFNFYPQSLRYTGAEFDPGITDNIPENIGKVGIFVNAGKNDIVTKHKVYGLNFVQLHGGEPVDLCRQLFNRGIQVIKVFNVDEEFDFYSLKPFKPYCEYFLFDTKCKTYGGSGKKFNWDILKDYDNEKPVFLSGGIDIDDISSIKNIKNINICAVDINSRFETEPGIKDIIKIKKFIQRLKY
jgi:phosphoribosylanthranilate isomerase